MGVMNGSRRMLSAGIPNSRCIIVLLPVTVAFTMSPVSRYWSARNRFDQPD